MGLKSVVVKIRGVAPLLMNSGAKVDPENLLVQQLKALTSKRNKTIDTHREIRRVEWMAGLYVDAKKRPIVPGSVFEACLRDGAKKSKDGKKFTSGVFVEDDAVLEFADAKKPIAKLLDNPAYRLTCPARVGTARVMRTRPRFQKWSATFNVVYNSEVVSERDVVAAAEVAGQLVGIGDWRPKFGRFEVK